MQVLSLSLQTIESKQALSFLITEQEVWIPSI